jgi:CDP-paratose synthetase
VMTSMILLTGSTGFLGSSILRMLVCGGKEVVAIKRSTSSCTRINDMRCLENVHFIDIDKQDPRDLFSKYPVKTIVHTATEYGRGSTPLCDILNANLLLPLQLAELGSKHKVNTFINTDSFFNKPGKAYSYLLNYSLSKKSLLAWLDNMTNKLKIVNVVLEHVYGPHDGEGKFVEMIIRSLAIDNVEELRLTHGHQKRDFVYVDDVANAFALILQYAQSNSFSHRTFEIGTGHAHEVRELVDYVHGYSKSRTRLLYGSLPYRSDEIMESCADTSSIRGLGWLPTVSMHEGIKCILDTYAMGRSSAI